MRSLLSWVLMVMMVEESTPARVLVVLPFPSNSHHIYSTAIMKALAHRGHQVVEYSPFPPKEIIINHSHVEIHSRFDKETWTFMDTLKFINTSYRSIFYLECRRIWTVNHDVCEDTFNHENITKLLQSNDRFDLVITESTFGQESLLVFGHIFRAPTITIEGFVPWSILNIDAGNTLSIASVPDLFSFIFENAISSFKGRILNFIKIYLSMFLYNYSHIPDQEYIIRKNLPYSKTPPLAKMVANVSLYLTNSHPAAVSYIQPYTPNIIPIGGITIDSERSSLPEEFQSFMDDAKEGVIYFSLGSNIKAHQMPKEALKMYINVFKRLPHRVLWKIKFDTTYDVSENVKLTEWAPQLGVLGHPNCKLFITHGGLFSLHETIHAGVPTVAIPFFTDQPYHAQFSQDRGIGVKLDFLTLSEDILYDKIITVLTNPKYKENAKRMSRIYRDRPMSPADSVVFWVEYVLRHKGAPHLKPASAALSWYQLALLDVLAAVLSVLVLLSLILFIISRKIFILVCGSKENRKEFQSKKKN